MAARLNCRTATCSASTITRLKSARCNSTPRHRLNRWPRLLPLLRPLLPPPKKNPPRQSPTKSGTAWWKNSRRTRRPPSRRHRPPIQTA
ncbi:hypothetical protein, partial [Serratia marcescens]|uniref:hypothetical protein n=1 Tax=Serratia marcescens TaxID=615 RepID=UPI001E5F5A43